MYFFSANRIESTRYCFLVTLYYLSYLLVSPYSTTRYPAPTTPYSHSQHVRRNNSATYYRSHPVAIFTRQTQQNLPWGCTHYSLPSSLSPRRTCSSYSVSTLVCVTPSVSSCLQQIPVFLSVGTLNDCSSEKRVMWSVSLLWDLFLGWRGTGWLLVSLLRTAIFFFLPFN